MTEPEGRRYIRWVDVGLPDKMGWEQVETPPWQLQHSCDEFGPADCIPCVTDHAGPPSSPHCCGGEAPSWECPACVEWDAARMELRKLYGTPSPRHIRPASRSPVPRTRASLTTVEGVYVKQKIPASLRRQVMERDAYRCVDCGTWIDLAVDHIYPESLGGPTELDNLATRCRPCNSRKGVKVLEESR